MTYPSTLAQLFSSNLCPGQVIRPRNGARLALMVALGVVSLVLLPGNQRVVAQSPAAPAQRDLILSNWADASWALPAGVTLRLNVGQTKNDEPLSRITLPGPGEGQAVLTEVNLPPTAGDLSMFIHKTEHGMSRHEAIFQDAQGWGAAGNTLWGIQDDTTYTTSALNHGWSWRVGFFKSTAKPPYRFRGFRLHGGDKPGQPSMEVGPVHVTYTPDDKQWLYTDLQPKTILSRDGVLLPLTLRVANLGTTQHTFRLTAQPTERNLAPMQTAAVAVGDVDLAPGQLKEIPIHLPLSLLGRYNLEYRAVTPNETVTQQEKVSVVNAFDVAAGFRHWAAHRQWFSAPARRPGTGTDGKVKMMVATANNGLSLVPVFPVLPRQPHAQTPLPNSLTAAKVVTPPAPIDPGVFSVLTTQLSPAWLIKCADKQMTLFGDTRRAGLGGPTHVSFATAGGTRVIAIGATLDATALKAMNQPWLLVWWAGSDGWNTWDVPYLVVLQHRPTELKLDEHGVQVAFAGAAGYVASQPLYGYAKLPQEAAWRQQPDLFRVPAKWPELHPWTWGKALPSYVASRCDWWARALTCLPYNVHETYAIDHAAGAVRVRDVFDYVTFATDWHTVPLMLAPLSPTYAVAMQGGYPMTVTGKLLDCQYPTLFGPYSALEGTNEIHYSLNIGPYWQQTADPNLTAPVDQNSPSRLAQAQLLGSATNNSSDAAEVQAWDYHDDNFVWYAQGQDVRDPAYLTGYTGGTLRQDRKSWMQARILYTLLDPTRYGLDERNSLSRRYIDGPGIGNWGSGDWGDSGKLGSDMIWDAYVYAYNSGDYQTIADKWDIITSLNTLPVSMSWLGVGRGAIAEMGDEAPPMLGLARLAYAVGDKDTYVAAVYWYGRELVHHVVKEGALTKWREQFEPWQPGLELPTETPTNLWGTNAAWQPGGFRTTQGGENQWTNFYVRLDDVDTWRFQQRYARELPRRVMAIARPAEMKKNYTIYMARLAILGDDLAKAQADYTQNDPKVNLPDNPISRVMAAWREFPPKMETLIPATAPAMPASNWAWGQMNVFGGGMVSPNQMTKGRWPTPQWYWWPSPQTQQGVEWGDKWTFGSLAPTGKMPDAPATPQDLNPVSILWRYAPHATGPLDALPDAIKALAIQAKLTPDQARPLAAAWDKQANIPVLAVGPFVNPGGGPNTATVHAPERAPSAVKIDDAFTDNAATPDPKNPKAYAATPGAQLRWQPTKLNDGALDFNLLWPAIRDKEDMAGYVALWVKTPRAMPVMLGLGSDDSIKVWLNGALSYDHPGVRSNAIDQDKVDAQLKAGWNSILLKVTQGGAGWALNFRIAAPNGLPIPDLEFSAAPPPG